ncbi:MAG: rRNA maturation RNase YbeY [Eubacteriales bacterium]
MTIFIEEEGNIELSIDYHVLSNTVIETCIDYMNCPFESEVNVLITNNDEIHDINLEQREIDKATDVLSFPMVEWNEIGDFDSVEEQLECFHPDSGELMLGDIIISAEKVLEQAQEYQHSVIREFAFLMVHSMLHLFGYDHMIEEERIEMEMAQSDIMEKLGITR